MDFKKIDEYLDSLADFGIPACELIITHKGVPVYHKCAGTADAEGKRPTSESDLYWLFSATKVVTCTAAMRLVEAGIISLDDPVSKYIPEFASVKVQAAGGTVYPAKVPMTILHLFTMTAGMSYEIDADAIRSATDKSTLGLVRAMASMPLAFEPGSHYRYSLCHDVLAAVIEVATGMKYGEYLRKNIFLPLGIKEMGFFPTSEQKSRFSAMYKHRNGKSRAQLKETENAFMLSPEFESGGAGLFGSASEYIKIITALALGGTAPNGYKLLSESSVRMMQENYLCEDALDDFALPKSFGYGWGLCGRVHIDARLSGSLSPIGEFGWDSAGGAYALVDPENQLAIFYAQHVSGCYYAYHRIHPTIRDMTYRALTEE